MKSTQVLLPIVLQLFFASSVFAGFQYRAHCEDIWAYEEVPVRHFSPHSATQKVDSIQQLKVMEFNVLDLKENEKPQYQLDGLGRVQRASNSDIMMMIEVWSEQAMRDLNQSQLNGVYESVMVKGNDERGLHLGAMWKTDLPFEIEMRSYKNLTYEEGGHVEHVFSRDMPVYIFRLKGHKEPLFVLSETHFKSKRTTIQGDFESNKKRAQQAEAAVHVLKGLEKEFGSDVPMFLTGDFNNHLPTAAEFRVFKESGYRDAIEINRNGKSVVTHFYFNRKRPKFQQLDGFLMNAVAQSRGYTTAAKVLPHLDVNNQPLPAPRSFEERRTRASDHLAVEVTLDFAKIYQDWLKRTQK